MTIASMQNAMEVVKRLILHGVSIELRAQVTNIIIIIIIIFLSCSLLLSNWVCCVIELYTCIPCLSIGASGIVRLFGLTGCECECEMLRKCFIIFPLHAHIITSLVCFIEWRITALCRSRMWSTRNREIFVDSARNQSIRYE
jgi:hypothetical protein